MASGERLEAASERVIAQVDVGRGIKAVRVVEDVIDQAVVAVEEAAEVVGVAAVGDTGVRRRRRYMTDLLSLWW
jgi:uncharacterized protein YunC (DUF1805 family)